MNHFVTNHFVPWCYYHNRYQCHMIIVLKTKIHISDLSFGVIGYTFRRHIWIIEACSGVPFVKCSHICNKSIKGFLPKHISGWQLLDALHMLKDPVPRQPSRRRRLLLNHPDPSRDLTPLLQGRPLTPTCKQLCLPPFSTANFAMDHYDNFLTWTGLKMISSGI